MFQHSVRGLYRQPPGQAEMRIVFNRGTGLGDRCRSVEAGLASPPAGSVEPKSRLFARFTSQPGRGRADDRHITEVSFAAGGPSACRDPRPANAVRNVRAGPSRQPPEAKARRQNLEGAIRAGRKKAPPAADGSARRSGLQPVAEAPSLGATQEFRHPTPVKLTGSGSAPDKSAVTAALREGRTTASGRHEARQPSSVKSAPR